MIIKITTSIFLLLVLIGSTLPMLSALTGVNYFIPALAILTVLIITRYPKIIYDKSFIVFYLYSVTILLIYYLSFDSVDIINIISARLIAIYVSLLLVNFITRETDKIYSIMIVLILLIIVVIRCYYAIKVDYMFPLMARKIAGLVETEPLKYIQMGVGTFSFINALTFLVIPIMYVSINVNNYLIKLLSVLIMALTVYTIYYTSWGISFIISIILVSFMIFNKNNDNYNIIKILKFSIIVLITLILFQLTLNSSFIADNINPILYEKLIDISSSISSNEQVGQVEDRSSLYSISIATFISNPLFGSMIDAIGGHAYWLDHLAMFGLVGIVPLSMLLYLLVKKITDMLPSQYHKLFWLNVFVFIVFGCIKNLGGYEFYLYLFVLGPLLVNLFSPMFSVNKCNNKLP